MAKKSIAEASAQLYKLLEPFEPGERVRMVKGTLMLLGDGQIATDIGQPSDQRQGNRQQTERRGTQEDGGHVDFTEARQFFNTKSPQGTIEALATAARFFETHGGSAAVRKDDFKAVFDGARRNFDASNFARDVDNGVRSGYFNAGGGKKAGYTLSHYGQDYIDALPNREAAKAIQRPKPRKAKSKPRKAVA